ncbi:hypothetical protein D3C80_1127030 [compost metagenome]
MSWLTVWASWYSDRLRVIRDFLPPNRQSASARAVSVLPTPLVPTNRNTPNGAWSSVKPVLAARRRWAKAPRADSWPITRSPSCHSRVSRLACSSLSKLPRGTPVQSAMTSATLRASTSRDSIGWLPWARSNCSCSCAQRSLRAGSA